MKELIKSYQRLLTDIKERIDSLTLQLKCCETLEEHKRLNRRRDALRSEYDDLIYALHKMSRYNDIAESYSPEQEVNTR